MTSHADLLAAATVGLAQRALDLSALPTPIADLLAPTGEPPLQVLDAAAGWTVAERTSITSGPEHPIPDPAPDDLRPEPRQAWITTYLRVLHDVQPMAPAMLAEGLTHLARAELRLPHRLHVATLDRALTNPVLAAALGPALGPRGHWLALQNPAWRDALAGRFAVESAPNPDDWEHGDSDARTGYLRHLRGTDPAAARALLEATWPTEDATSRANLIATLKTGLSESDEPFLDDALRDRAQGVRSAARYLLVHLPGSRFVQRMRARARANILLKKGVFGRRLILGAIAEDADTRRDGLGATLLSGHPNENLINAVAAALPPAEWPEIVGVRAVELIGLTSQDGWTLRPGLAAALMHHPDPTLAAALASVGTTSGGVLASLPSSERAAVVAQRLPIEEDPAIHVLLDDLPAPWPASLTRAVAELIADRVKRRQTAPDHLWEMLAQRCDIDEAITWTGFFRHLADEAALRPHQNKARAVASTLTLRTALYSELL